MYPYEFVPQQQQELVELPAEPVCYNGFTQQQSCPSYEQLMQSSPPPLMTRTALSSSRPILIPSTSITGSLEFTPPFHRAYPPILASYGISSPDFMAIIDALNIAIAEAAPFKALDVASTGIGLVPNEIAQGVSLGLGIAAGTGSAATAYIRSKRLLDRVNREVFASKGLVLKIVKDEEVMQRLNTTATSLDPLQRLQEIGPYVEVLSFDVESPAKHENVIDRISAKQAAMKQASKEKRKQKKRDRRLEKRERVAEKYHLPIESIDEHYNSDTESCIEIKAKIAGLEDRITDINANADARLIDSKEKKADGIEKRRVKHLAEVEKDRARLSEKLDKATARVHKKAGKKEEDDKKEVARLEWIMIRTV